MRKLSILVMAYCVAIGLSGPAFAVTVSSSNIHIYGSPSGANANYLSNDTITVVWDNSITGDNNPNEIVNVEINFFGIQGVTNVSATSNGSDLWEASYTLQPGDLDDNYVQAYVTADDPFQNSDTTASYESVNIDTIAPRVSQEYIYAEITNDLNGDGIFNAGDTVRASWDNTASGDNNHDVSDAEQVSFNIFDMAINIEPMEPVNRYFSYDYTAEFGNFIYNFASVGVEVIDDAGLSSGYVLDDEVFAVNNEIGGVVPIPASVWLFGSGLAGLVGIARCNRFGKKEGY